MVYEILNDLPESYQFSDPPQHLTIVLCLEVVLKIEGQYYLLVTCPFYPPLQKDPPDSPAPEETYWAPPFVSIGIPVVERDIPQTVGVVMERFKEARRKLKAVGAIKELAFRIGIGSPNITEIGEFTELKNSTRWDTINCYQIVRYSFKLKHDEFDTIRDLTDPECLRGHFFLPIDRFDELPSRPTAALTRNKKGNANNRRSSKFFFGKPIITNLHHVLKEEASRDDIKTRAISVDQRNFLWNETGLLILADISKFGRAFNHLKENRSTYHRTGDEVAKTFQTSIAKLIEELFLLSNLTQTRFTGDGFLCAIPDHQNHNRLSAFRVFFDRYTKMLTVLDKMNSRIQSPEAQIGSRLAVHWGGYEYGRVGGPSSMNPNFDGPALIEIARYELGLAEQEDQLQGQFGTSGPFHHIVISESAQCQLSDLSLFTEHKFKDCNNIAIQAKEAKATLRLFSRKSVE